jgi:hypothetical protein
MNIKNSLSFRVMVFALLAFAAQVQAQQIFANDAEWKETDAPPPPAFDVNKLILFDVPTSTSLVYGVDPATISISKSDSLVRYVVVATSASGVRNVMYEALRCSSGELKTYARYLPNDKWSLVSNPQWRSVFDNMPSKYPLRRAKAGACDQSAPAGSVTELVNKLKNPPRFLDQ